jgi:8-oxo-dGTP diphosphatase
MERFSAAILIKGEKILLGKRSRTREFYPNVWDFIGGHCEENESFVDAMLREIKEELGVVPTEFQPFLIVDKSPQFVMQIFTVKQWFGEIENLQPLENEEISWFSIAEALKLDFPDDEYKKILNSLNLSPSTIA